MVPADKPQELPGPASFPRQVLQTLDNTEHLRWFWYTYSGFFFFFFFLFLSFFFPPSFLSFILSLSFFLSFFLFLLSFSFFLSFFQPELLSVACNQGQMKKELHYGAIPSYISNKKLGKSCGLSESVCSCRIWILYLFDFLNSEACCATKKVTVKQWNNDNDDN